jgi:hypothetical protein
MYLTKTYPDFLERIQPDLDNIVTISLKSIDIEDYHVFILICLKPVALYIDLVEKHYLNKNASKIDTDLGSRLLQASIYITASSSGKYNTLAEAIERIIISFKKRNHLTTFPFIFVATRFYRSMRRFKDYDEFHQKFEYMLLTTKKVYREIPDHKSVLPLESQLWVADCVFLDPVITTLEDLHSSLE